MLMGSLVPWMVMAVPRAPVVVEPVAESVAELVAELVAASAAVPAAAEATASRAGATQKDRMFLRPR